MSTTPSNITSIYSVLVKPKTQIEDGPNVGTAVPLSGRLFDLLNAIFEKSADECTIDIVFRVAEDGSQYNEMRELLIEHVAAKSGAQIADTAMQIAAKLGDHTTHVTGPGLLFIISGTSNGRAKLLLSRFPADEGIMAEEKSSSLTVEFVDKLFMKDRRSYKAVLFEGLEPDTTKRKGRAVDKQINDTQHPTSRYWINNFLQCEFLVTSAAGTLRFADALKDATNRSENVDIKADIAALARTLGRFDKQLISPEEILEKLRFEPDVVNEIRGIMGATAMAESFEFDAVVFSNTYKYQTKVLDNGAILTADTAIFDSVFEQSESSDGATKFTTIGRTTQVRIGKQKFGA